VTTDSQTVPVGYVLISTSSLQSTKHSYTETHELESSRSIYSA